MNVSELAQMGHYNNVFKNWSAATMGAKPTADMLAAAHGLGCRAGKQALARALEMRAGGATTGQVVAACIAGWGSSGTHHNKRDRELVPGGYIKLLPTPDNAAGHKVYRIELTAKGKAKVQTALKASTPAKADAAATEAAKPATATKATKAADKVAAKAKRLAAAEAKKAAKAPPVAPVKAEATPAAMPAAEATSAPAEAAPQG